MNPQFNCDELKKSLQECGIKYIFLGHELGARSEDATCYENGRVQFDRLAHTKLFRLGLDRVRKGMQDYRIALMCAEKEPLECHRTILVARHLASLDLDIQHIHADGELENHADAATRLKRLLRMPDYDLFRSSDDVLADAYYRQAARIAYDVGLDTATDDAGIRSTAG